MRIRLLMCAAVVAVAAACGADDAATTAEPTTAGTEAAAAEAVAGAASDLPDLDMVSVHSGETVALQSLVSGETPLLLWFWAPH